MEQSATKSKKKVYSSRIKFQAILEVIKGRAVGEVARTYGFHPTILPKWKKRFEDTGHTIFEESKTDGYQKKIDDLTRLLGKKEIEIELLKKYLGGVD